MNHENSSTQIYVARHGILVPAPPAWIGQQRFGYLSGSIVEKDGRHYVVVPPCRNDDIFMPQPPLGITFTEDEIFALLNDLALSDTAHSATDFGPVSQAKGSNQDFALAICIAPIGSLTKDNVQFSALADGVTTKTFWPERTARIAVLVAWRVMRQHLAQGLGLGADNITTYEVALRTALNAALNADREMLMHSTPAPIPPGWDPTTYGNFTNRSALWYNSTLSVAAIGSHDGFILSCGDGGLVVRKATETHTEATVLVSSNEDVSVSGIISLDIDAIKFKRARISVTDKSDIEVIMATDGVDRTLRTSRSVTRASDDPYGNVFSRAETSKDLLSLLNRLYYSTTEHDNDNISVAIISKRRKKSQIEEFDYQNYKLEIYQQEIIRRSAEPRIERILKSFDIPPLRDQGTGFIYLSLLCIIVKQIQYIMKPGTSVSAFDDNRALPILGYANSNNFSELGVGAILRVLIVYEFHKIYNDNDVQSWLNNTWEQDRLNNLILCFSPGCTNDISKIGLIEVKHASAHRIIIGIRQRIPEIEKVRIQTLVRSINIKNIYSGYCF